MTLAPNPNTVDLSSCPDLAAVGLQAEMDPLIALSNCPKDLNPCNAGRLTPLGFTVYEPEKSHA